MSTGSQAEFGRWRSFFWPVHRVELRKFVPLLLMFFCIAFNYNLLRSIKDTLLVTARESGAEAIPFIKVWAILPMAILFTWLFTRLNNRYSREKVFYVMMSIFLVFFFLFTFILYPAREYLHPHEFADYLQTTLPAGFKGLIALLRNWTFTLYYVMSELWSTAILTVLFWGFANEVTNVQEARRFYGILATGANISAILSGLTAVFFSGRFFIEQIPYGNAPWEQSLLFLNTILIVNGLIAIALFRWLHKHVLRPQETSSGSCPVRPRMSLRQSFSTLGKSKYLICIALIVVTYNLALNLVEVVWKGQIKELYPDSGAYNAYMGEVMTATGVIATIASILFTSNILRRFSWTGSALIPPLITFATGVLFFLVALYPNSPLSGFGILLGISPLMMGVTFGSLQNCMARASKYTLFDATKELAFIPLDPITKLKGKSAIDGVGSRVGKSGGSVIQQGLLLIFSTLSAITPFIAIVFLGICFVWIGSVVSLGKQFDILIGRKPEKRKAEALEPLS